MYQAPRGTQDVLPEDAPYFLHVEQTARRFGALFGYQELRTPTFEDSGLFSRHCQDDAITLIRLPMRKASIAQRDANRQRKAFIQNAPPKARALKQNSLSNR